MGGDDSTQTSTTDEVDSSQTPTTEEVELVETPATDEDGLGETSTEEQGVSSETPTTDEDDPGELPTPSIRLDYSTTSLPTATEEIYKVYIGIGRLATTVFARPMKASRQAVVTRARRVALDDKDRLTGPYWRREGWVGVPKRKRLQLII